MNFWICGAMANGGVLTANQLDDGSYLATMEWPALVWSVFGETSDSLVDALESLDSALHEVCGSKMVEGVLSDDR
jgi:hypothetical protein